MLLIRVDGNSSIGMGHLVRCSALAEMLRNDFKIIFILKDTPDELSQKHLSSFEIVKLINSTDKEEEITEIRQLINNLKKAVLVLDGYSFDSEYQKQCGNLNCKLVYIDDLVSFKYTCDVLINQADFVTKKDYDTNPETKFCLGPEYALLRPSFLNAAKKGTRVIDTVNKLFVSFGGADSDNITYKLLNILNKIKSNFEIHILTGPVNENIDQWKKDFSGIKSMFFYSNLSATEVCELINNCELAFCPSSSLSLEVCAVGCLMITGTTADNQKGYYKGLLASGAADGVGSWKEAGEKTIEEITAELLNSGAEKKNQMLKAQRKYIDGLSDQRLEAVFSELIC